MSSLLQTGQSKRTRSVGKGRARLFWLFYPDQSLFCKLTNQRQDFGFDALCIGVVLAYNDLCHRFHRQRPVNAFPYAGAYCVQAVVASAWQVDDQSFVVNRAGDDLARISTDYRLWTEKRHMVLNTAEGLMTRAIIA